MASLFYTPETLLLRGSSAAILFLKMVLKPMTHKRNQPGMLNDKEFDTHILKVLNQATSTPRMPIASA